MSAYTYVVHHVSLEAKGRAKYFSHHMMSQNGIPGDARQAPTKSPGTMEKTTTPIVLSKLIGPQAKQKKLAHLAGQSFHMVAITEACVSCWLGPAFPTTALEVRCLA